MCTTKAVMQLIKMATSMPPLPANFKSLQHYLKTAQEHEQKSPLVSYYCEYIGDYMSRVFSH